MKRWSRGLRLELLVLLFFLVSNLSWIARDTRPWPVIDCYGAANNVMRVLGRDPSVHPHNLPSFLAILSFGGRPPLYQMCTLPLVALFGYSEDAFLAVNLAMLALLFLGIYGAGRELRGRWAGMTAAVVTVSFPPIVFILRQYRPYSGAFAGIALTIWALLVLLRTRRPPHAWLAAAAATAALMMHPVAAQVLLLPMASTWLWLLFRPERATRAETPASPADALKARLHAPLVLRGLLPAALLPTAAVAGWFLTIGRTGFHRMAECAGSWLSSYRGVPYRAAGFHTVPADFRWLALTAPHMISWPLALLIVAASVWLLLRGTARERLLVAWLAAAYLAVGVFIHVLNWQYGAFALPFAGVVLGAGAASVPGRRTRVLVMGTILSLGVLMFTLVVWGWPTLPAAADRLLGTLPPHRQLGLSRAAPEIVYTPRGAILAAIAGGTPGADAGPDTVFVITPPLTAAAIQFEALRFWPRRAFRITGHGSQVWGAPFPFDAFVTSRWIAVRTPIPEDAWKRSEPNLYLRALSRFFRDPPPSFAGTHRVVGRFPWPGRGSVVLYRRNQPLSLEEVDATVEALALEPRFVTGAALTAAKVLERGGRTTDALARLEGALRIEGQPPGMRARILAYSAKLLFGAGRVLEAERRAREALAIRPRDGTARAVLERAGGLSTPPRPRPTAGARGRP